jgi:hypothetical protein
LCVGSDAMFECIAPGSDNEGCPEDTLFHWWTWRCYPRADLRPVR